MPQTKPWPWPDEMDAVIAAPKHHRLVLETDRVRVLDTVIPAGDTVPVHTHRWPAVYYTIQLAHFIRRDGEGNVLFDSRKGRPLPKTPAVEWLGPMPPHSVENVGTSVVHLLIVELKRATA